ncbi:MAG: class E sortase [Actinomycetota bacterium]
MSRRVPYFERPKQPRDWRLWVGGLGKVLITLGLLMFAFVAYQLWGTGIQTARSQDSLQGQFDKAMQSTTSHPSTTAPPPQHTSVPTSSTSSTTTAVPVAAPNTAPEGQAIAQLNISSIGLSWYVVQGVGVPDLKKGPGHFPETPLPGQLGNAAVAGHRTTYGAPFYDLDKLKTGDLIEITTFAGHYTYQVVGTEVVSPSDYAGVIPTRDHTKATLTLSTCTPIHTSRQRLIIHADLVSAKSDQVFAPPSATADPTTTVTSPTIPGDTTVGTSPTSTTPPVTTAVPPPTTVDPLATTSDTFSQGWFADSGAILPSILWGLLLSAVGVGAYFVGKRYNRLWVCFAVGFAPFIVVLYFFFENINRLLPPGL